jgi:hypothetical protein
VSTTAELSHGPKESEAEQQENLPGLPYQESANQPGGEWLGRVFSEAPGEPPANGVGRLLRSPTLSHPVNNSLRAAALQRTQRNYGNHFAQGLLPAIQRQPADSALVQRCVDGKICEEGQAAADIDLTAPPLSSPSPPVIQASAETSLDNASTDHHQAIIPAGSSGEPLHEGTRGLMESRFGEDFSGVRVHTGAQAGESAKGLRAEAYTSGRDIYFAPGKYAPNNAAGQRLLAHELTHVVQQRQGAGEPPGTAHEAEADSAAREVQSGAATAVTKGSAPGVPQLSPDEDLDKILKLGAKVEPPTAEQLEAAMTRLNAGTATVADQQILLRQTIADARTYIQAEQGRPLSWDVLHDRCGPGRDVSAASFGALASDSPQPISISRFQAKEVFGYGKHGFSVVTFSDGTQYIVDPTFGQFLRPGTQMDPLKQATAQVLRGDPAGTKLATELVQNGFVPLTPENAKLYARGLGVPEAEAESLAKRLFKSEHTVITELVGGGSKTVAKLGEGGPDILDREELIRFLKEEHIPNVTRAGDPHNLLPRLRKLVERLEEGPGIAPKVLPGGGEPKGEGGAGEGEGGGGGGGGFGGLFRKALFIAGVYSTGKRLKEAYGTEEFGPTVVEEGMTWASALTPLGPLGPPLMSFMFAFGEAWGQAIATFIQLIPRALEAMSRFAKHTRTMVGDILVGHTLAVHESLDPDNWDLALMPNELIGPTDQLGTAIWAKLGTLDLNEFRTKMVQPLSELGLPPDVVANFAAHWSLLQTKQTGTPTTLAPDQVLAMTPEGLVAFLKADKLRFLQDPEILSHQAFYGGPSALEKGEETRLRDLVEQRAMINPYNWDLSNLPDLPTVKQDKTALEIIGITLWGQLAKLEKDEFQKMSNMPMSTFTFSADQVNNAAKALTRLPLLPFQFDVEGSPEFVESIKETFLNMTPQDLIRVMRERMKLRFKQDPADIASDAIDQVKQGYRPWPVMAP